MSAIQRFISPYRVTSGKAFRLRDFPTDATGGIKSKEDAADYLAQGVDRLREMQEKLYADDHWAVLLIFQAMDAAGKDSTIKHVMSGVNPQGVQVYSFKAPSDEELDHDFLWRTNRCLPERGRIGIFNRSYYEEVLVVRVHPELLDRQRIPKPLAGNGIWKGRYQDINCFERYLTRNGIAVVKFFLNVSKKEQKKRFLARLDEPDKLWKFSANDVHERQHWSEYHDAYQDAIRATASDYAPWYIVPADHKWFTRLVVAAAVIDKLESLKLHYPKPAPNQKKQLQQVRQLLDQA